jgi:hypothetical protein
MTYLRKGIDEHTLARDLLSAIDAHRRTGRRPEAPDAPPALASR